jgi:hypothetical protein
MASAFVCASLSESDRSGSLFGTVFAECDQTLTVQILEADPASPGLEAIQRESFRAARALADVLQIGQVEVNKIAKSRGVATNPG